MSHEWYSHHVLLVLQLYRCYHDIVTQTSSVPTSQQSHHDSIRLTEATNEALRDAGFNCYTKEVMKSWLTSEQWEDLMQDNFLCYVSPLDRDSAWEECGLESVGVNVVDM